MTIILDDNEKNAIKEMIEGNSSNMVLSNGSTLGFIYNNRLLTISVEDPRGIKCVVLGQDKRILEFLDLKNIPLHRPKILNVFPNAAKRLMELVIQEYEVKYGEIGRFYIDAYAYNKARELVIGKFALLDRTPVYESSNFWTLYEEIMGSAKACISTDTSKPIKR